MASFTTVCFALALLATLNEASRIRLTTNHLTFNPGTTGGLNIRCVVENTGIRDFTKVDEIQIKRDGQLVAIFNEASTPVGLDTDAVAHVSGDLTGTSGNHAYLLVHYDNPPAALAGVYVCDAVGVDDHNQTRVVEGRIAISTV